MQTAQPEASDAALQDSIGELVAATLRMEQGPQTQYERQAHLRHLFAPVRGPSGRSDRVSVYRCVPVDLHASLPRCVRPAVT